jgi:hypothetical protein
MCWGLVMGNNSDREIFLKTVGRIALKNAEFLEDKGYGVLKEVEGLIEEVWRYDIQNLDENLGLYLLGILQPLVYGAYLDLLIGNLPAYFMGFRLLLESLAYCYMASIFPKKDCPLEKIFEKRVSISRILKEFGASIGQGNEPFKLWRELSDNWCHALFITKDLRMKGMLGKTVEYIEKYILFYPSIPLPYRSFDEELQQLLNQAEKVAYKFRKTLRKIFKTRNMPLV